MKQYLLDTHIFIWLNTEPERVKGSVTRQLFKVGSELYISAATVWEVATLLEDKP